jgi:hypothetical protein
MQEIGWRPALRPIRRLKPHRLARPKQASGRRKESGRCNQTSRSPLIHSQNMGWMEPAAAIRVRCGWRPNDISWVGCFTGVIFGCQIGKGWIPTAKCALLGSLPRSGLRGTQVFHFYEQGATRPHSKSAPLGVETMTSKCAVTRAEPGFGFCGAHQPVDRAAIARGLPRG